MNVRAALEQSPVREAPPELPGVAVLYPPEATAIPASASLQTQESIPAGTFRFYWFGLAAVAAWALLGAVTLILPDRPAGFNESWAYTREFGVLALVFSAFWATLTVLASFRQGPRFVRQIDGLFRYSVPWIIVSALIFALWEYLTAKQGVPDWAQLNPPFFAPPSALIDAYLSDYARLADSAYNSVKLLLEGILWGVAVGFITGVSIGWSKRANYWVHPILRLVGPLPPTALLPLAFFFFPSSHAASVFLIALATGFPVAILSWSGVASVNKAYYDVARTMGASEWFLIFRVAVPAALPQVFVGLFMGFGASFVVLIVAEMMGVKSGLGWYLTWAQGYAAYVNMYAALIIMTIIFSGLISLLFAMRDRVLIWQKGIVKW
ncbi:MAG: ABC transporter permease subunit [Azoarcus sp.]|jgi:NitT/TauT family transport system permease protein|nr:ABC transporter permease subunit [Azoarcus sp.]